MERPKRAYSLHLPITFNSGMSPETMVRLYPPAAPAETMLSSDVRERGRPEQVIVSLAGELTAQLVVLHARESPQAYPRVGPPSVGHTARFVVDHSPTIVLLLRERGVLKA